LRLEKGRRAEVFVLSDVDGPHACGPWNDTAGGDRTLTPDIDNGNGLALSCGGLEGTTKE